MHKFEKNLLSTASVVEQELSRQDVENAVEIARTVISAYETNRAIGITGDVEQYTTLKSLVEKYENSTISGGEIDALLDLVDEGRDVPETESVEEEVGVIDSTAKLQNNDEVTNPLKKSNDEVVNSEVQNTTTEPGSDKSEKVATMHETVTTEAPNPFVDTEALKKIVEGVLMNQGVKSVNNSEVQLAQVQQVDKLPKEKPENTNVLPNTDSTFDNNQYSNGVTTEARKVVNATAEKQDKEEDEKEEIMVKWQEMGSKVANEFLLSEIKTALPLMEQENTALARMVLKQIQIIENPQAMGNLATVPDPIPGSGDELQKYITIAKSPLRKGLWNVRNYTRRVLKKFGLSRQSRKLPKEKGFIRTSWLKVKNIFKNKEPIDTPINIREAIDAFHKNLDSNRGDKQE